MDTPHKKAFIRCSVYKSSLWWFVLAIIGTTSTYCQSADLSSSSVSTSDYLDVSPSTTESPQFDYSPYLRGINGGLKDEDLEYGLDYYNEKEKILLQDLDFSPDKTVKVLIDSAAAQNTTPEQFFGEIQDLMYLQNRSKTESKDLSGDKSFRESWKTELKRLEKKYQVSSYDTYDINPKTTTTTTTAARLALMFPHALNLGQKPFADALNEICVTNPNGYYSQCVPSFFRRPEFGGLIPREGPMNETARRAIFTIHLYFLQQDQANKDNTVPFRTRCVLVKKRMDKSLVSDERRRRMLENNGVIQAGGELTPDMEKAFDYIPTDFKDTVYLPGEYREVSDWRGYIPQRMKISAGYVPAGRPVVFG